VTQIETGTDDTSAADNLQSSEHRAGALFWLSAAAGWVGIGFGLWGIFSNRLDTRPANLAKFVVGGALLHDLLFAPLVLLAAVALARVVPGRARSTVLAALFVTGAVALFSYPLVRAYGLAANNPTSLPHNYALNLAIVVAVVWAVAAAVLVVRLRRPRRRRPPLV
jgi:mannitol-specific phosphotransferase system IIBC component